MVQLGWGGLCRLIDRVLAPPSFAFLFLLVPFFSLCIALHCTAFFVAFAGGLLGMAEEVLFGWVGGVGFFWCPCRCLHASSSGSVVSLPLLVGRARCFVLREGKTKKKKGVGFGFWRGEGVVGWLSLSCFFSQVYVCIVFAVATAAADNGGRLFIFVASGEAGFLACWGEGEIGWDRRCCCVRERCWKIEQEMEPLSSVVFLCYPSIRCVQVCCFARKRK